LVIDRPHSVTDARARLSIAYAVTLAAEPVADRSHPRHLCIRRPDPRPGTRPADPNR